jgi:hypothetical protein
MPLKKRTVTVKCCGGKAASTMAIDEVASWDMEKNAKLSDSTENTEKLNVNNNMSNLLTF